MRLSFCVRPSLLLLSRYDTAHDYITFIAIWCLCQQSSSRIQNEPGYRKRQFLSITTWHRWNGQRKMLELKEVKKKKKKKKNKNKRATTRWTDWREKKERKEESNVLEEKKKKKNKKPRTNQSQKREKKEKNRKCKWIAHSCNFYLSLLFKLGIILKDLF